MNIKTSPGLLPTVTTSSGFKLETDMMVKTGEGPLALILVVTGVVVEGSFVDSKVVVDTVVEDETSGVVDALVVEISFVVSKLVAGTVVVVVISVGFELLLLLGVSLPAGDT